MAAILLVIQFLPHDGKFNMGLTVTTKLQRSLRRLDSSKKYPLSIYKKSNANQSS